MTDLFDGSGDVPREKLSAYFDELALKCHDLQKYVSDSVHFLTAYSLGQYQQVCMCMCVCVHECVCVCVCVHMCTHVPTCRYM